MTTPFIAQLLRDLRDAVRSLKKEKKMEEGFATAQNAAENALQGQYEQIGHLNRLLAEKEAANAKLKTTVEMLQKERVVLRLVIGVCIAVVVALICRK
jgi:septal ring factor EnvC (AmiA/AmiB activator)